MEAAPTAGLTCRQVRLPARHLHEGGPCRAGGRFPFTFPACTCERVINARTRVHVDNVKFSTRRPRLGGGCASRWMGERLARGQVEDSVWTSPASNGRLDDAIVNSGQDDGRCGDRRVETARINDGGRIGSKSRFGGIFGSPSGSLRAAKQKTRKMTQSLIAAGMMEDVVIRGWEQCGLTREVLKLCVLLCDLLRIFMGFSTIPADSSGFC